MKADKQRTPVSKFPLRLMPSVRKVAEEFSHREGVSLNQFINVAVAEKLAHLQHEEWLTRRAQLSSERISQALGILDRHTRATPSLGDELPKGYRSIRESDDYKKVSAKR